MKTWLLWTIVGIAIVTVATVILFQVLGSSSDPSYLCGDSTYDPETEVCINKKICKQKNACGKGGNATCINPATDACVNGQVCDINKVCTDSSGASVCYDPKTQTCLPDGTLCTTTNVCGQSCIDPTVDVCINGKACGITHACSGSCCEESQKCSTNGKCVDCADDLCEGGRKCCDTASGEKCINDTCCIPCGDSGVCCPESQQCIDATGECCDPSQICLDNDGNQTCCAGKCCNGICCAETDKCINGSCCPAKNSCDDGTCCDNECCGKDGATQCCSDGTVCHNGSCMTACGDNFCDPNTQVCNEISTTGKKYCVDKGCVWQGIVYSPANLRDNIGSANIPVCGYNGKYYTCRDPTGVTADNLSRTVSDLQDSSSITNCTANDCDYRFSEKGLDDIQWDTSAQKCTGSFDCTKELPVCNDCPVSGSQAGRCCTNSDGTYTGQLCPQNTVCDSGTCYAGYYCGKNSAGFPLCIGTTDRSKATYSTLTDCQAAGCKYQPASCYHSDIKKIVEDNASKMQDLNYGSYIWVAVYGIKSRSCVGHSDHTEWIGDQKDGNPWIGLWKCTNSGYARHYYVCTLSAYDGKVYFFDVRSSKDSSCILSNAPTLQQIIQRDDHCSSCDSIPTGTDVTDQFDFAAYAAEPNGGISGRGYPAIAIIVPKAGAATSCSSSDSLSLSFQGFPSFTPWNPAGVL